ncbi:WecB/TagA/CpsF family glycosyltransferase [Lactobacillus sp. PV034]|uniref:WecB/TagA/CpsF family glycosyltransferase n=1 Tax=Lactobacillus sp. PV034 TaxID=2594495 RepID=UPI00223FDA5D|nr:WecB/TagA/CpsF family glycosyltransferase [Lactobacillus sp. PV034]QNQ80897.1 WecB/TagA/CpsF family glycosyltransferase [Lactobacillus sp. PV034]
MSKVEVLGINFDNYSLEQFKNKLISRIDSRLSTFIVTANPEIVMLAQKDKRFLKIINSKADIVTADGIGIVLAGKMQKTPINERVTGYDLFVWLLHVANLRKLKVYLIGAKPEVIQAVKNKIDSEYSNIELVGYEDGYFTDDLDKVANRIAAKKPDMVFAAIGFPRQEQLLSILRKNNLPAIMMGVGGSFDVFSGKTKRAPLIFQKAHLEWFYRLLKEPTRFKRMLVLPQFVLEVRRNKKQK